MQSILLFRQRPKLRAITRLLKYIMIPGVTWDKRDIKDHVYIVTGGTGCLGTEAVARLAILGARIILLCQDTSSLRTKCILAAATKIFGKNRIYGVECDLNCISCVTAFVNEWLKPEEPRRLDGIICSAFYLPDNLTYPSSWQAARVINVNFFNQMHLIRELHQAYLLQPTTQEVRIVIVTSLRYKGDPLKNFPPTIEHANSFNRRIREVFDKNDNRNCINLFFQSQLLLALFGFNFRNELQKNNYLNINVFVVDSGLEHKRKMMKPSWGEVTGFPQGFNCFQTFRYPVTLSRCTMGILFAVLYPTDMIEHVETSTQCVTGKYFSELIPYAHVQEFGSQEGPLSYKLCKKELECLKNCIKCLLDPKKSGRPVVIPYLDPEISGSPLTLKFGGRWLPG